jgi:predicted DNA-binding transcriptional regulator YafY
LAEESVSQRKARLATSRQARRLARALQIACVLDEHREEGIDVDSIARTVNCSRRTVFRDLSALREAGLDIKRMPSLGGLRMRPLGFLLSDTLKMSEAAALLALLEFGDAPLAGSGYEEALAAARRKTVTALLHEMTNDCRKELQDMQVQFASGESVKPPFLNPLR